MNTWHHDRPAQFFGAAALLTLCVSIPATYALLRPFHDSGEWIGLALTAFAMLVFEVGAVGAKLITIAIPQWKWQMTALTVALLVLTSVGNYLHGAELFRAAVLPPTLAELRTAGASPWLVGGAAALFPALLFVWLVAFTARVEGLTKRQAHVESLQAELAETRTRLDAALNARAPRIVKPAVKQITGPTPDKRKATVKRLVDGGMSKAEAARQVGVTRQTVSEWMKETTQ